MSHSTPKRGLHWLAVPAAALALFAAGCGSDDDEKSDSAASGNPPAQSSTAQDPAGPAPQQASGGQAAGGEDAVRDTILKWTFSGDCDLMTDTFLEAQAFVGDTRAERCGYVRKTFQKPQYSESDVKFRKVEITGDKAVATVGSDIATLTADYHLVSEGGQWKIDEAG